MKIHKSSLKSTEDLEKLFIFLAKMGEGNLYVRSKIASYSLISTELLNKIFEENKADQNDYEINLNISKNPKASPVILSELAKSQQTSIKKEVAKNLNSSEKTLALLANDENAEIRKFIASNPNIPSNILKMLEHDTDRSIIRNITSNPNAPKETLTRFFQNIEDKDITKDNSDRDLAKDIACNPNTPKDILLKIYNMGDKIMQYIVIQNSSTTKEDVFRYFADSKYFDKMLDRIKRVSNKD